jgi:hypothetical protein
MKTLLLLVVITLIAGIASTAKAETLYTYKCGPTTVALKVKDDSYALRLSYPAEKDGHTVVITSDYKPVELLKEMFNGGDESVDDETQTETGLPSGSLAFSGFHYANGDMYITAEGETNEEGYTFAIEKEILSGKAKVKAAGIFWSEWHDSQVSKASCKLVK